MPNDIPMAGYPFCPAKEGSALLPGRMSPRKGAHLAIAAARAAGAEIVMVATCHEAAEQPYAEAEIRPRLGAGVRWVREAGTAANKQLLAKAACLALPTCWEEPSNAVMVLALACGTPVVAMARGGAPETVIPGAGYPCSVDELPGATAAALVEPAACRAAVRRFDASGMLEGYEVLSGGLVAGRRVAAALCEEAGDSLGPPAVGTPAAACPDLRVVTGGPDAIHPPDLDGFSRAPGMLSAAPEAPPDGAPGGQG